jgi:Bacterial PH domain
MIAQEELTTMYALPRSHYLRRSLLVNSRPLSTTPKPLSHEQRIKNELKAVGVSRYGIWMSESRYLPHVIHPDEHIGGVVYGYHADGLVMLVATDRRVIFLDKKPLFINEDEFSYMSISGVSHSHLGIGSTVKLHTRIRDYSIRTFNEQCADTFVTYIESQSLEFTNKQLGNKATTQSIRR